MILVPITLLGRKRKSSLLRHLLLSRCFGGFLLADIFPAQPKGKQERHCRERRDHVKDTINALGIRDQNASDLAGIEDFPETRGSCSDYCPGVCAGILLRDQLSQGLGEDRGAEAEE